MIRRLYEVSDSDEYNLINRRSDYNSKRKPIQRLEESILTEANEAASEVVKFWNRLEEYGELVKHFMLPVDSTQLEKWLTDAIKTNQSALIVGEGGWGKSNIVEIVAKKMGYNYYDFALSRHAPEDLGGYPVKSKTEDGKDYIEMRAPKWVINIIEHYEKTGQPTVLFLDEINHARADMLNACYRVIHSNTRRIADHYLKDEIRIVAAMNFQDENRDTTTLSTNLVDRFDFLFIAPTEWKRAIEYLLSKPQFEKHADFINKQLKRNLWSELRNPRHLERILNQINLGTDPAAMRVPHGELRNEIEEYILKLNHGIESDDSHNLNSMRGNIAEAKEAIADGFLIIDSLDSEDTEVYTLSNPLDEESKQLLKDHFGLDDEALDVVMSQDL